jgi:DNA primase catalytic core
VARVPEHELARIKAEVSLVRLVESAGVVLKRQGKDLVGRCPFHDDRTPSLVVTPAKNLWHCLGACQAGGSVVDWVMATEGVSFRHAVELLRVDAEVLTAPVEGKPPARSSVVKLPPPVAAEAEAAELLGQAVGFYHATLKESPEAQAYLAKRGLDDAETVETFRLGYANRTLGYRLPDKQRVAGRELRGRLQRLGILRPSGHEHFNGSLVVPITDAAGRVVEVYGRKIRDDLRKGTPAHLYLPGPHRGVLNLAALQASAEIIVCEAVIDALTFWRHGFRHVTTAFGIEGFGPDLLDAMRVHGTRRVLIAYDRDPAGDKAAARLADQLTGELGVECFRITWPRGQDVNSVAVAAANPVDVLGRAIRSATWMGAGDGPATLRRADPLPPSEPPAAVEAAGQEQPPAPDDGDVEDDEDEAGELDAALLDADDEHADGDEQPEAVEAPASSLAAPAAAVAPSEVSPVPAGPPAGPTLQVDAEADELRLMVGDRRWRVRGLAKVSSFDLLRVNVLVAREADGSRSVGAGFHVDTLDLYSARARTVFVKQAADELGLAEEVVKRDLGRVLLACEDAAEEVITAAQAPKVVPVTIEEAARQDALDLLTDPKLVDRIVADFAAAGMVGETDNLLVGYLAATSRKLARPLAVIVQSTSAAGKSTLMDAILSFVPSEEQIGYSAMTGQALYYLGDVGLAHKVLSIAEEEGVTRAAYALKLLQSEGALSIASTGKDPATGRLVTHDYQVEGPVAIFLTTTAIDLDEELLNRCLVLTVDETAGQTRAIQAAQRHARTLDGLRADVARRQVLARHRDAQRLLSPVRVVIPWADKLAFADARTRTRRDHVKYLTLIEASALLHQHQRPRKTAVVDGQTVAYIEASIDDVALANRLAAKVLGHSLDELPPQTRRLLETLDGYVSRRARAEAVDRDLIRFTRRQLREATGWGDTQLKVHLARLVDLELVMAEKGPRGGFVYELAWDGHDRHGRAVTGLVDLDTLTELSAATTVDGHAPTTDRDGQPDVDVATTSDRSGPDGGWSGSGRPPVGGRSGVPPTAGNGHRQHLGALSEQVRGVG